MSAEKLLDLAHQVIRAAEADVTEVVVIREAVTLTRYANNRVHQNTHVDSLSLGVRLTRGRKQGTGWTQNPDREGLLNLVQRVSRNLAYLPDDPDLPEPYGPAHTEQEWHHREPAPQELAEVAHRVFQHAGNQRQAFGMVSGARVEHVYLNTAGAEGYRVFTDALLNVSMKTDDGGSGWAQAAAPSLADLPVDETAERAARKADLSRNPEPLEPGEYPVILEPLAFSELLDYLAFLGFSGRRVYERRSPLGPHFGSRLFSPNFTLWDDPLRDDLFPYAFDWEGVPRQKRLLVDAGTPTAPLYNLRWARKAGAHTTGHAVYPFADWIVPTHLVVAPGTTPAQDLLKLASPAILVTRFWYTNVEDPMSVTLTGMTRDGTFLVKNGQVVKGIRNLRFTQSVMELLQQPFVLSREQERISETLFYDLHLPMGSLIPWAFFERFRFTGATQF